MAESLGDKLKRIAAEKKAARELADKQASAAGGATPEVKVQVTQAVINSEVTSNEQPSRSIQSERSEGHEQSNELGTVCEYEHLATGEAGNSETNQVVEGTLSGSGTCNTESEGVCPTRADSIEAGADSQQESAEIQSISVEPASSVSIAERTTSDHPLSMQFAEMEQALLAADPTFKTILRDVHRQLGQDPELVTMMTEEEIQLVVRGLLIHANADIIEPAKAKAVKKDIAAVKKKVISADDL